MMKDIEDIYELSPLQQGMLFDSLSEENTGLYVYQMSYALHGNLNVAAFERAWQQIVLRHQILRASFHWEGLEKPVQVIHPQAALPFRVHDWRALPEAEQQRRLAACIQEKQQRGFDFTRPPLLQIDLFRRAENVHQFVWSFHHLLLDAWSTSLLLKEALDFYKAFSNGQSLQLKRPRSYREYLDWYQQQDFNGVEKFWRNELKGLTTPTPLVVGKLQPNTHGPVVHYDELHLKLAAPETAALRAFAQQQQLTLNTLFQGAWALLLSRYSGENDVLFGNIVSGRSIPLPGVEAMIGLFVNLLPARVQVDPVEQLAAWLKKLQAKQVEMRQYEFSPLVQVKKWSELPAGLPMFESILIFENWFGDFALRSENGALQVRDMAGFQKGLGHPIAVAIEPREEIAISINYDRERFEAATIQRLLGHYHTLLKNLVAMPAARLADLPMLAATERRQMLVTWNETQTSYPPEPCLHEMFEAQAARTPNAVAIVFEDQQITFRELDRRANQLAQYLQKLGIGPEVLVGIYVERSLEMFIAVLGVLKTGGAYVPLDPMYPPERVAYALEETKAPVLLTTRFSIENLKFKIENLRLVCLDTDWPQIAAMNAAKPATQVTPQNLAYVIFTSGSTGKPKGVAIIHQALVNLMNAMRQQPGLNETEVMPALATLSFDMSVPEVYLPLVTGARLVLASRDTAMDGRKLMTAIVETGTNVIHATPATWRLLIESGWQGHANLKMICGAEPMPPDLPQLLFKRGASLWNMYGPTETTVWSTFCQINPDDEVISVGRPLANTQVYLCNDGLQPVPIGVPGTLYIAGDGLARGYFKRPDLAAEKFIPNPFAMAPGARMYDTGDLARYFADGRIECLGRGDHQVKLRGFRIELGEIEAVCMQHPAIAQVVVLAREDEPGNKRLVAYATLKTDATPAVKELRQFLKTKLPDYMVPSAFVFLHELPRNPNGKIDRKRLPAPEANGFASSETFVAPQTEVERQLAEIWAKVLSVGRVGRYDNFFELGGHSLLAMQVSSRVLEAFQIELPVRRVFESPALAELAAVIEQRQQALTAKDEKKLPAITRRATNEALPLSFAQQRLWFLDRFEPGAVIYNIPLVIRILGKLDIAAVEWSLNEIVRRHEALRTTFGAVAGQPIQLVTSASHMPLEIVSLQTLPKSQREAEARRLATQETKRPFDLEKGPLLRSTLLRLDATENVLILVVHHIVFDGWSLEMFMRELKALYEAFTASKSSPLPELAIQYADFAIWQRQWLQGEALSLQLNYWKQQLADMSPVLELPTDRPRPAMQSFRGAAKTFLFSKSIAEALLHLGQREGATLFMTLLAAFKVLLHRYSGQRDIAVGTPVANRNHPEIESLIGFFVNTLVLRTEMSDNPSFRELLARVRQVTLGAYDHQELPFEKLVEELQLPRDLSRSPLVQAMFSLQSVPNQSVAVSGLRFNRLQIEHGTAMFDLSLFFWKKEDGLIGVLEYNTDLFDADTIGRMIGHYETLLKSLVANPQQRLHDLPLLTATERQQLLVDWNATQKDYARELCWHELFEAQAARTPDAVAVVFENEHLTYGELNARANQLAHYLSRRCGVRPEVLVGLCMERSVEMLVGLLGILKAGGAYVPLDPAYPLERIAYVLKDAAVPVLLMQNSTILNFKSLIENLKLICLDTDWKIISAESTANCAVEVAPENLAYAIYTSGSTGWPKGVGISHRALVNFLDSMRDTPGLHADDTLLAVTTLSFDIAGLELYLPLLVGGRVVLASRETASDGKALMAALEECHVTVMQATPATWRLLLESGWAGKPDLKILCGGEALPRELANQLLDRSTALWNMYGPTETTIWSTLHRVETRAGLPSIGRPIANTQVYLLDRHSQIVPVGVHGELCLGGEGLARGYLNRPELTAEKFIPNADGERIYKTGDVARYLANGQIECLGRIDHQVKIRGFRIELGEIEAVCAQHPAIAQVVVVAREDEANDKRLVAYVVSQSGLAASALRQFMKTKLPDYMVPSAFVFLDELPLTPNGKIDRKRLPAPEANQRNLPEAYVAPTSPLEKLLAGIWHQLLPIEKIGIHDNFFEIGGHSLLATQVNSRLHKIFGIDLPLRTLFEAPTVAALSQTLTTQFGGNGKLEKIALMMEKVSRMSADEKKKLLEQKRAGLQPATPTPAK
ncbi:MAG: Linear gramicidin synthase subunit B [bacterium]|nr:Linear gramicidin synthase subunit B [bacterium]